MKNKVFVTIIVVLALILAALVGLLIYLEKGQKAPEKGETTNTTAPFDPLETKAPVFTFATEGEEQELPQVTVSGVDPMDPYGATEGPEVDPTLGMNETEGTVDPTAADDNELPIVPG